jgi:hypothetical protein
MRQMLSSQNLSMFAFWWAIPASYPSANLDWLRFLPGSCPCLPSGPCAGPVRAAVDARRLTFPRLPSH